MGDAWGGGRREGEERRGEEKGMGDAWGGGSWRLRQHRSHRLRDHFEPQRRAHRLVVAQLHRGAQRGVGVLVYRSARHRVELR